MRVCDALSGAYKELSEEEVVVVERGEEPFIFKVPHSSTPIPEWLKPKLNTGRELLINTDLHTGKVFNPGFGSRVVFGLNTCSALENALRAAREFKDEG